MNFEKTSNSISLPLHSQPPTITIHSADDNNGCTRAPHDFRIRTITLFVTIEFNDFINESTSTSEDYTDPILLVVHKVHEWSKVLQKIQSAFEKDNKYEVQTTRVATNSLEEWLLPLNKNQVERRLKLLDNALATNGIEFCSLGPSSSSSSSCWTSSNSLCSKIIQCSPQFSCSILVETERDAELAAKDILHISKLEHPQYMKHGLGNFRFCVASHCSPFIPFFPVAKSDSTRSANTHGIVGFALGFENGKLANKLLSQCLTLQDVQTSFRDGLLNQLIPVDTMCKEIEQTYHVNYLGMDPSLNPSLEEGGSVATAIEFLLATSQVDATGRRHCLGDRGSLAGAAAVTKALQSFSSTIKVVPGSYCGLMLPVCEDTRLAELATHRRLTLHTLLTISSVCGVGIDTVPIPGDCTVEQLKYLILDVVALATRYNKPLTCRVFPVANLVAGDMTTAFNSFPYLCNTRVFDL
jgi:hypothetical protein